MLLFDHRMVEGSPLHYQCNKTPGYHESDTNALIKDNLFRPYLNLQQKTDSYPFYEGYPGGVYNMSEDMLVPLPQSPQISDSESSISSVELKIKTPKCCWRNCGIEFDTLDELVSHVSKVHGASGPGGLFYCGWEGCTRNERAFNARYKMLVHVRTHTNEKPHQCYQCDKSFSRAENLKIHIRSHSGEKPYVCPVPGCNKAYSNSSDRFKHTRTHQVDKPYKCKVPGCSKRYTDPSSLRKHVKTYKHFIEAESKSDKVDDYKNYKEFDIKWSRIIDSKLYAPYDLDMDIDGPLDLSISRKSS